MVLIILGLMFRVRFEDGVKRTVKRDEVKELEA